MSSKLPNIIAWDYQFAPNAQKARNYLYATQTPFKICEQPFVIPRPILQKLGITYRRVPVLSIGKDFFPDNTTFLDALQGLLEKQGRGLKRGPFDRAFEQWGYVGLPATLSRLMQLTSIQRSFWIALSCLPAEFVTPELAKDRAALFPVFAREDYASLQNNSRAELSALLQAAEKEFLNDDGPCIGGTSEPSFADIHSVWMVKWWLQSILPGLNVNTGHSREELPRVYRWCVTTNKL